METKYNCEKCQYKCNYLSEWNEHLTCKKHTGEKRKERCDKILVEKCTFCDYKSTKTSNMKLHILTHHSTKEDRKVNFKFYCEKCNFGCFSESCYNIHNLTQKHNMKTLK